MIRRLYFVTAVLGTVLPLRFLVAFVAEHGIDAHALVFQLFQTNISTFFAMDVVVSSLALWVLVLAEGRRLGMRSLWVYIATNLLVGVSLALPLFLFVREGKLGADEIAR